MIDLDMKLLLPLPWKHELFETHQMGPINFLVGPNGSGKSQFAVTLYNHLRKESGSARFLGTDRLKDMARPTLRNFVGDPFATGFAKNSFSHLKTEGEGGSGIDTIVLLEERMDLRIQVEATLSHLFDREIMLEWDSGNLIPKAELRGRNQSYRLDRDECHGIKELLVLLTHLYDDKNHYLIIDEPELNLHPQYQAFFMQEVRKVVGDLPKGSNKKVVFLITHSPFMLDFRSLDDLNSVISFSLDYSIPKQVCNLQLGIHAPLQFIRRLNAHHKQLFFSDSPVFVEGILDSQLVEALMAAQFTSVAGAGSCIIDAGGAEEVNHYFKLCQGLGKTAYFLYDLDSIFSGNLRECIKDDESIQSFLASAGLGSDFAKYCGLLEKDLTGLIAQLLAIELSENLYPLGIFLKGLGEKNQWKPDQWKRARTAVMTAISRHRADIASVVPPQALEDVEGRRNQILTALKEKNIHVLPGGTIERYLPHYKGDEYTLSPDAKRQAVYAEIEELAELPTERTLLERYGDLYKAVHSLPSKSEVDLDVALNNHLSKYIHELQRTVVNNPDWQADEIRQRLVSIQPSWNGVFSIQEFGRTPEGGFEATIGIIAMLGQSPRVVHVNHQTNAGMGDFIIELAPVPIEATP